MISPFNVHNSISYLYEIKKRTLLVYWFVAVFVSVALASLPFIKVDISIISPGIVRPFGEKAELKSSIIAAIDKIYFKEGDSVKKGEIVIQLRKQNISIRKDLNDFEISQRQLFINDLIYLSNYSDFNLIRETSLKTPLYKKQYSRLNFQLTESMTQIRKVEKELFMDSVLIQEKVISAKEMFDKRIEYEKLLSNINYQKEQQIATWQQELSTYQIENSQYRNANAQLNEDSNIYSLKASVNGVLQGFNKYYEGTVVQAGETIAEISPTATLIAECYLDSKDIGLLKLHQPVNFQVSAFDYNYFGILTGHILSIGNDYTLIDNKPEFKVMCQLDSNRLYLKNGFAGIIVKGMTLQARFIINRRSLYQLLFDKMDDWINPMAPLKKTE